MEHVSHKLRHHVKEEIECWDDDDDLGGVDDLQFRNISSTTAATNASSQTPHHRDSVSSRLSARSDSNAGGDEDWQVLLPADDEFSTANAINSAKSAGIPIPTNVPTSALLGGTIKRLGGRKLKKVLGDDWSEGLEIPKPEEGGLKLRRKQGQEFPDALRQISLAFAQTPSPAKPQAKMSFMERIQSAQKPQPVNLVLDKFRDDEGGDDFLGDVPTIKVAKNRSLQKPINFDPPPAKAIKEEENFEDDLEFPASSEPLKLPIRREMPKTPASQVQDDVDTEWAEGSLGIRFGGTRREAVSGRSSSFSALSPSVSSCLTAESEDEGLDGLVLPDGPLKFDEVLKKRMENLSPDPVGFAGEKRTEKDVMTKEDFFTGIEIGDGDVFDSGKLTLNRNIKHKTTRQTSPQRRTAMSLTFTNKPQTVNTRIPRPQPSRSKLEPVSETGGPIPSYRKTQSRMGGHSTQSSITSIPTPSTPSFPNTTAPSTPSRRGLDSKLSHDTLRSNATTTNAQLLRAKRSAPAMRSQQSPARSQPSYQRPPSRVEQGSRQALPSRPKTPVDRSGAESSLGHSRKPPVPFLPAGTSVSQSHHITAKSSRHFRRPNSSDSNENIPLNRPMSRVSNTQHRPGTPTNRKDMASESLAREAAAKRTMTKPARRRAFGDGSELEVFDDLPTSATVESKFVKQPVGRGPKSSLLRNKLNTSQNPSLTSLARTDSPQLPNPSTPQTPLSPSKHDTANVPRFARDTNASRIAREQRTGSLNPAPNRTINSENTNMPLAPLSTNWKARIEAKTPNSPRHKRSNKPPQKPFLIKAIGNGANTAKSVNGMHWNPQLFRWEGNENALVPFDVPIPTPGSPKASSTGNGNMSKPALIANVGSTKGVQVVGGMVFDPQRMCWLKMGPGSGTIGRGRSDTIESSEAMEEEDVFAGLDDLEDKTTGGGEWSEGGPKESGLTDSEWLVGEEFDVGPEFVKRQRAEEEKWRRKVEGWVGEGRKERENDDWRWAIRGLIAK
ncbi:hypothetical protein MMC20_006194 [Loxospora ochrophaea]|nr:hypothetical protein [Loxospora ochrophaea]